MAIKHLYTTQQDIQKAVQDLKGQITGSSPDFMVIFASSKYNPEALAAEFGREFSGTKWIGCTTAGEIVSGKMLNGSIVAMTFEKELEDLDIQVIENISTRNEIPQTVKNFENHFEQSLLELDHEKYVGIILIDGLSKAEERVMDQIGNLTSIPVIGGSAGDDLAFQKTYVFANGSVYTDAAILAIIKPAHGFDTIKTQSFEKMPLELVATGVLEADRKVLEFNHKPAVKAYAEALGIPEEQAGQHFMDHPLGLMMGNEPYVRSPQQVDQDKMVFYCSISEGMKLNLLKSGDMINDTRKIIQEKEEKIGKIRGIINFNCILRTLELQNKNLTGQYGEIFSHIPTIGFSTYGEEYIGHINQTATMLVFK